MSTKLASEQVIINSPMSFAGSAQRSFRLLGNSIGLRRYAYMSLVICLVAVWWVAVLCWYIVFGLFLVPYRLLRRGARKRRAEKLRHQEMLTSIESIKTKGENDV